MALKIIPEEIRLQFRAYIMRYLMEITLSLFASIALIGFAAVEWIHSQYSISLIAGIISFALSLVAVMEILFRLAHHEVKISHSPDDMQFLIDYEAVQLGYMDLGDFMRKHTVRMARIMKMQNDYLASIHDESNGNEEKNMIALKE